MHTIARALIISVVLFAVALCVLFVPLPAPPQFLPEQIEATNMRDSSHQEAAHAVWTVLIAITCIVILVKRKRKRKRKAP
jgi:uncharacterized membrane protein